MKVRVDGALYRGRALDLRDRNVPAEAVVRSIVADSTGDRIDGDGPNGDGLEDGSGGLDDGPEAPPIAVRCRSPDPAPSALRRLPNGASVRGLLAAAARSRGRSSSLAERIETTRATLSDLNVSDVDVATVRRRLAEASGEEERLRERVATLRGELETRRELDADSDAVESEFREATAALSEAETQRIAAEQALERAEEQARAARETRERRLELQDRLGNLRRRERAELANAVYPEFRAALDAVPSNPVADGGDRPVAELVGDEPADFDGDRTTAALAAARVADFEAPVVLAPDPPRFDSAVAAADCLDAPVVRCRSTPRISTDS